MKIGRKTWISEYWIENTTNNEMYKWSNKSKKETPGKKMKKEMK